MPPAAQWVTLATFLYGDLYMQIKSCGISDIVEKGVNNLYLTLATGHNFFRFAAFQLLMHVPYVSHNRPESLRRFRANEDAACVRTFDNIHCGLAKLGRLPISRSPKDSQVIRQCTFICYECIYCPRVSFRLLLPPLLGAKPSESQMNSHDCTSKGTYDRNNHTCYYVFPERRHDNLPVSESENSWTPYNFLTLLCFNSPSVSVRRCRR